MKRYIGVLAALLTMAAAAWWLVGWWASGRESADGRVPSPGAGEDPPAVVPREVTLSDTKIAAAGIRVGLVGQQKFQRAHQVPGRLRYDDTRHVEIKAATDGIVHDCHVKPGDRVVQGATLVVLSSPEIGAARADVMQRQAELERAERQFQWHGENDRNLQQLVGDIQRTRSIGEIESQYRGRQLGGFRETLLAAYSRFVLAESLVASIQPANDVGAVALRTLRERSSERQMAEAALQSACEQTAFESRQLRIAAEAAAQDARRRLAISRQHLATLLGYDEQPGESADKDSLRPAARNGAALSLIESRAPFAGTIENRTFSVSERVKQGDTLLVLADTSRLWVEADVREQDWPALGLESEKELELEFPALPGQRFVARLYYLGREVAPGTNAIPLVAWVDNPNESLRPGLFARVSILLGEPREALAVPAAAVAEHEGQQFVFVPVRPNVFHRVDVQTGQRAGEWIEITAGLPEQSQVVVQGTFFLKSELLLEREE